MKDNRLASWEANNDPSAVAQNMILPKDPNEIPQILGWAGPARSGTTALLFLLAGHPEVGHVYFQPQKTFIRLGHRPEVYAGDNIACMKETFFSWDLVEELHDPIKVLLDAGVPAEKITWVMMLRDPRQTFASWGMILPNMKPNPDAYILWHKHTINLWHKYKDSKVRVVPFVYELLRGQEEIAIKRLLSRVGMDEASLKLEFDGALIKQKFVPGQASDKEYFRQYVEKSLNRGKYMYTTNSYSVDKIDIEKVVMACQEDYEAFLAEAKKILSL